MDLNINVPNKISNPKSTFKISSILGIICSILFYKCGLGINAFIVSFLLPFILFYNNKSIILSKYWWFYVVMNLLGGLSVMLEPTNFSIMMWLLSIMVLITKSMNLNASIFYSIMNTLTNILSRWMLSLLSSSYEDTKENETQNSDISQVIIPLALLILMAIGYSFSSPLFSKWIYNLLLAKFDFGFLLFLIMMIIIVYGALNSKMMIFETKLDTHWNTKIISRIENLMQNQSTILYSLIGINLFLFVINSMDVYQIFILKTLPINLTMSDFVHCSVWSLAFSIGCGINLIIYYTRVPISELKNYKTILLFVYLFVFQNISMIGTVCYRNYCYIQNFQLTEQRLGVYLLMFFCVLALILLICKVKNSNNTWWLLYIELEGIMLIFVLMSLFSWSNIITEYNIKHATEKHPVDEEFLMGFYPYNINKMIEYSKANHRFNNKCFYTAETSYPIYFETLLTYFENKPTSWQSWNYSRYQIVH